MKFKGAVTAASKGKTVISVDSGNYYLERMGFLQAVGGTKAPSIAETLGEWKIFGADQTGSLSAELVEAAVKVKAAGGSLTKFCYDNNIEYPKIAGALMQRARRKFAELQGPTFGEGADA